MIDSMWLEVGNGRTSYFFFPREMFSQLFRQGCGIISHILLDFM